MNDFITRSLRSLSNVGYVATILLGVVLGYRWGASTDSVFTGLLLGFVLGMLIATVVFGLVNVMLGIQRNTAEMLLVTRYGPERAEAMLRIADTAPGFVGANSTQILNGVTRGYLAVFFAYMFLPLLIMVAAAFNANRSPSISPWQGFTFDWFARLIEKSDMWQSVLNSIIIGLCVVVLSVVFGLAGAFLLTRLQTRAKSMLYAVMVSPVLTPGVILGVSTLLLWNEFGVEGGLFLSIVAQTTFISAYCMLLFMARLQRFDPVLEEAALDLGASHQQVFWKITLPFLKPSVLTAAVLAFLQSFENYNTTLFTIGRELTLTIFIGSAVKQGQEPTINALAVIFITVTVVIAIVYEVKRRAEKARTEMMRELAKRADMEIAAQEVSGKASASA